jgi:TonB family protein
VDKVLNLRNVLFVCLFTTVCTSTLAKNTGLADPPHKQVTVEDSMLGPYLQKVLERIQKEFAQSKAQSAVWFTISVAPDGKSLCSVTKSSGQGKLDTACFEAIKRAGPFGPPPGANLRTLKIFVLFNKDGVSIAGSDWV